MAVSSEVARVAHTANGTATFFSFSPIDGATSTNLKVYLFNPTTGVLTLQTLGTDYTFGGGGVTFTAPPPAGRRVILYRVVPLLQPDNYKTNAPFPAVVTEKRFDEVVRGLQQINDIVQNRAIILPLGDAGFSVNTLPAVEGRKGRVLYFNATTGNPEAQFLANTILTVPAWAHSFLSQPTAAAGLANIGAVARAGDTMTGALTLPGPPTATNHAATKGYVDSGDSARVAKAGDTMTGALTLPGPPTATNHAATRGYVDTEVGTRVAKAGDTMTGQLAVAGELQVSRVNTIAEGGRLIVRRALDDANSYSIQAFGAGSSPTLRVVRLFSTPQEILTLVNDGTLITQGPVILPGNPTSANHAANRGYVNNQLPVDQTSVHENEWSGTYDLSTNWDTFFEITLASNVYRLHVTCWYSIGQDGAPDTIIDYELRCLLLDASNNQLGVSALAYGRVRAASGAVPTYTNGGGTAVFNNITTPNSGHKLRFQARKNIPQGPFNLWNYRACVFCARRPSP